MSCMHQNQIRKRPSLQIGQKCPELMQQTFPFLPNVHSNRSDRQHPADNLQTSNELLDLHEMIQLQLHPD